MKVIGEYQNILNSIYWVWVHKSVLVDWVLWHINHWKLFNAKSIFIKIVLFQTIQLSINTQFKCEKNNLMVFGLIKQS